MTLRFALLLILALAFNASAEQSSSPNPRSTSRGSTGVQDWRLIMPNWGNTETAVKTSPWGASFYMEVDSSPEGSGWLAVPAGSTYIQNFAEVDYAINKNTTVFVRPTWNTEYAPANSKVSLSVNPGNAATKMGDTVLGISERNILNWQSGGSFNAAFRFYAPTAEADRTTGLKGEYYLKGNIDQPVNSWLRLWFDARAWYAVQTQDVYLDPNDATKYKGTYDKEFNPYFTAVITLARHLKFYQSAGMDYTWMRGIYEADAPTPAAYSQVYLDTSFGTDIIKNLDLRIGAMDEPTVNGSDQPRFFGPGEYFYYMWFVLSI